MSKEKLKPIVKAIGEDGNVFYLLGICSKALKNVGQVTEAKELSARIFTCGSYNEALSIMQEYCEFT